MAITTTNAFNNVVAYAIYAITDVTFTTLDANVEGDTLIGQTLSAGGMWIIPINGTVTLAGGSALIYQH